MFQRAKGDANSKKLEKSGASLAVGMPFTIFLHGDKSFKSGMTSRGIKQSDAVILAKSINKSKKDTPAMAFYFRPSETEIYYDKPLEIQLVLPDTFKLKCFTIHDGTPFYSLQDDVLAEQIVGLNGKLGGSHKNPLVLHPVEDRPSIVQKNEFEPDDVATARDAITFEQRSEYICSSSSRLTYSSKPLADLFKKIGADISQRGGVFNFDEVYLAQMSEAKRNPIKTMALKSPSGLSNSLDSMEVLVGTPTAAQGSLSNSLDSMEVLVGTPKEVQASDETEVASSFRPS